MEAGEEDGAVSTIGCHNPGKVQDSSHYSLDDPGWTGVRHAGHKGLTHLTQHQHRLSLLT